jgi:hypothetical protein
VLWCRLEAMRAASRHSPTEGLRVGG